MEGWVRMITRTLFSPIWRRACLIGLCFLFICAIGRSQVSQELPIRYYNMKDGLSHSMVSDVVQDSLGLIWIATEDGITRWDGYRFTPFLEEALDSTAIPFPRIFALAPARNGKLWLAGEAGIACFDPQTEIFTYYRSPDSVQVKINQHAIRAMLEDREGQLWVGSESDGLWLLDPVSRRQQWFSHQPGNPASLSDASITCILEDQGGRIWIGTKQGLNVYRDGGFQSFFPKNDRESATAEAHITCLVQGPDQRLWVGTRRGIFLFDPQTAAWSRLPGIAEKPVSLDTGYVTALAADARQKVWIGIKGKRDQLGRSCALSPILK